ncbi:aldo-keto reductase family 1 member B1 [Leptinotarsa decemlineata]|uniref:aldo-keto reductase family 1 member B1 n=1 Tax=Leptinotarsa decemlineata TaxID=7539 RepID=UPI003D308436
MNVPVKIVTNGMKIPTIGLGTWQATSETEIESALNTALECGYRHIDTAYAYQNEEIIGRVLKNWFTSGKLKREEVFITTKLPIFGVHEDRVEMFMDRSLKNLGLKYVDIYLIHFPIGSNFVENGEVPLNQLIPERTDHIEIWKKMEEQVDAGKAKFIGVSNFNERQIEKIWNNCRIKPACQQIELQVFLQQPKLVNYCHEKNIAVVAYSPLASPKYNNFMADLGVEIKDLPNVFTNPIIREVAEKHKKTNAQIALRYLIDMGTIPIPKSVSPLRIRENFEVFDFSLDADDMKKLKNLDLGEPGRICDCNFLKRFEDHPEWPFPKSNQ